MQYVFTGTTKNSGMSIGKYHILFPFSPDIDNREHYGLVEKLINIGSPFTTVIERSKGVTAEVDLLEAQLQKAKSKKVIVDAQIAEAEKVNNKTKDKDVIRAEFDKIQRVWLEQILKKSGFKKLTKLPKSELVDIATDYWNKFDLPAGMISKQMGQFPDEDMIRKMNDESKGLN